MFKMKGNYTFETDLVNALQFKGGFQNVNLRTRYNVSNQHFELSKVII